MAIESRTKPFHSIYEGEIGRHGEIPVDVRDSKDLQVEQHLHLVADLLERPDQGQAIEHVHALGETLLGTGIFRHNIAGIDRGTPYHILWKPSDRVYRTITALPSHKQEERSQIMNAYIAYEVDKMLASAGGFLSSRLATIPWQQQMLMQQDSSRVASIGISWKGAEGTTIPFLHQPDPFTLETGVEQVQQTLKGVGKNLGIDLDDWIAMMRGFWGHSYGGLLAFRHLLKYGHEFPYMRYGLITPVIMGAKRPKNEWPQWLKEVEKYDSDPTIAELDDILLGQHVYILDNSPLGKLVRFIGTMKSEQAHEALLNLGEHTPVIDEILKYFIGVDGLGSRSVLPVYKQSLRDYWYNVRDTRLLDQAPYIAGDQTIAKLPHQDIRPFAIVAGGIRKKGKGDTVLASPHMYKFAHALQQIVGIVPKLILDENSSHHPREEAINQLIGFTVPA